MYTYSYQNLPNLPQTKNPGWTGLDILKCEEEKASNPLIGTWEMRDIERLVETDHHFTYPLKIIDNYLKILIILLLSVHRAKITQVGK